MVVGPCVHSPLRWIQAGVTVQGNDEMRLGRDVCSAPPVTHMSHSRQDARTGGDVKEDYGTLQLGLGRNIKVTDGSCQKCVYQYVIWHHQKWHLLNDLPPAL